MSLLLEALKRAEKAKEEAQRRAEESAPAGENKRVLTRDNLPDISQPLEIVSDDLGKAAEPAEAEGRAPPRATTRTGAPQRPEGPAARPAAPAQRERAAARRVFEAKLREPDPRRPFYVTLAVLGACAIGIIVYFWFQLRPPPVLVIANPRPPAGESAPPATQAAAPSAAPVTPMKPIRGMPTGEKAPAAAAPAATPKAQASASPPRRTSRARPARRTTTVSRAPKAETAARAPAERSNVITRRAAPSGGINPSVEAGYAAYQAGDLARAGDAYRKALADEPENRDALLGLAAVEARLRNPAAAQALYARVLDQDPRDVYARAGLLGLRGAQQDPVVAESRLKNLLATDPDASGLQFALGNQYARQDRWAEAQQAYFKAFTAEPENAYFAYNLAVSLDHLHKPALALDYYRRALALAGARNGEFDRATVEKRVQELAR